MKFGVAYCVAKQNYWAGYAFSDEGCCLNRYRV